MLAARPSALLVFALSSALLACSSATEPTPQPEVASSPALPEPQPTEEGAPAASPPSALTPSPSCGEPGSRVVLSLGWTSDKRVPECMRPDDFEVRFGSVKAPITMVGPTNDGFCVLDVLVPAKAKSGVVSVKIGRDVFQSPSEFVTACSNTRAR